MFNENIQTVSDLARLASCIPEYPALTCIEGVCELCSGDRGVELFCERLEARLVSPATMSTDYVYYVLEKSGKDAVAQNATVEEFIGVSNFTILSIYV